MSQYQWLIPRLDARLVDASKKSGLAGAIRYTLSHWDGLTRFLKDGRIEIDNNQTFNLPAMAGPQCAAGPIAFRHRKAFPSLPTGDLIDVI